MSEAKFHLVARASILASGDTDDFHHVAPDAPGELVLVSVESFDRVTRERDEETRKRYAAERERDEARAEADLRGAQLAMVSSEVSGDPKLHWLHDRSDPRWTPALQEAWALRQKLKELAAQTQKAESDAARLREALTTIERTGAPGATIVARRSSDEHSCSWCRGMVTPCPVVTAREAIKEES